ncbi:MAG TPA: phosphoribosylaminoimidazolesuccinocarboxamide synthase [Actinomycetaceae bacterium]|nr:phosphoribosylaminoimidazolesuccinocarboxamide synthase [Actinomycetaceae bacterium]
MIDIEGWAHTNSGKVRDLYVPQSAAAFGSGEVMLVVASDRISAFDHVLPSTIPGKGVILTQMSLWWFKKLEDLVPNHLVSLEVPEECRGRAMIVDRLHMFPIECVARGYLTGSGFAEYRATGEVCGNPLPPGLRDGEQLAEPIFTPAAKAPAGEHDINITFAEMRDRVGEAAYELREITLAIYERARQIAADRGLILADTKFEFGQRSEEVSTSDGIVLADEVLTPDSSRFWPMAPWSAGEPRPSIDKQYVRDWLLSPESGWNRASGAPPPPLPDEIIERTRERYIEAYEQLTGESLVFD